MLAALHVTCAAYMAPIVSLGTALPASSSLQYSTRADLRMGTDSGPREAAAIDLDTLKARFRLHAARCDRGFSASGTTIEQLRELAADLEAAGANQWIDEAPTASPLLLGRWDLDFCDASDVLSLSLLPLPLGGRVGPIYQSVVAAEAPGKFTVQNGVTFRPPGALSALMDVNGLTSLYEVEARCAVLDNTRVSLAFVGARTRFSALPALGAALPGSVADQIITGIEGIIGQRVYLETTYLDDDMRIARGPQRELYVLSKESQR